MPGAKLGECLGEDFRTFGAMNDATDDNRQHFEAENALRPSAGKKEGTITRHAGVLQGAEGFMASWHKIEEEASRLRAIEREL